MKLTLRKLQQSSHNNYSFSPDGFLAQTLSVPRILFNENMKAYKFYSRTQTHPTIILDTYGLFHTTLEEFKKTYGLNRMTESNSNHNFRSIANSRVSLSKDKTRLNLQCDPMRDDLSKVFSEWLTQKPGFETIKETELKEEVPVEEFKFPF